MGQLAHTLRDLLRMARVLREAAAVTHEQSYIDKFNRAAAELEHRARELAGLGEEDALPVEEDCDTLRTPVDMTV